MLALFIGTLFASVRKASLCRTNSSDTELQRVAHTSEGVVHLIPVSTFATWGSNPPAPTYSFSLRSLSMFTLYQSVSQNLSDTWWTTFEIGVVQLHSVTEIAPKSPLSGSFSNDDGDGNENAKRAMGLLSKTTTSHVLHAFLSLHDYHVKMPDFTLYGGRNQATTNFSFFFQTWMRSPRNQL